MPARAFDQPATGLSPPVNAVLVQSPQQSALLRMPLVTLLLSSPVELQTQVVLASREPDSRATADFLLPGKAYV